MESRSRVLLVLGGVAVVAAAVVWRLRERAVEVETAVATRGDFEEVVVEDGRTRARWHVDLTAPVTGDWTPRGLQPGDTVRAEMVLGTLGAPAQDPATAQQARARVGAAQAALEAASANVLTAAIASREAERARERVERLVPSGGVSEEQLEQARAEDEARRGALDAARAQVAAAEYELAAARAFVTGGSGRTVELRAPADGIVLRVDEEHSRVVPAGAPLLQVGALGDLEILARVLSSEAPRVKVGAAMTVLVGRDTLRGHVTRIEPTAQTVRSALGVEEQRVTVIGDIHSAALRVGHDFQVEVRIVTARLSDVILVPSGALIRFGGAYRVFVVDEESRVRERGVEVIGRGADLSAVRGVEPGERVVVYPPEGLTVGARVAP